MFINNVTVTSSSLVLRINFPTKTCISDFFYILKTDGMTPFCNLFTAPLNRFYVLWRHRNHRLLLLLLLLLSNDSHNHCSLCDETWTKSLRYYSWLRWPTVWM